MADLLTREQIDETRRGKRMTCWAETDWLATVDHLLAALKTIADQDAVCGTTSNSYEVCGCHMVADDAIDELGGE